MSKYKYEIKTEKQTIPGMIMQRITGGSSVLEFGPADGMMTEYMRQVLGCHVSIVEIDPASFESARVFADDGICADIEAGTWKAYFAGKQFDYILFADVLEHLHDPQTVLAETKDFLCDGGEVIVSLPNLAHNDILVKLYNNQFDYTSTGILDNTHIHFWGIKNLQEFSEKAGYRMELLDGAYLCPFESEQNVDMDRVPQFLLDALYERDYNDLYQIFMVLRKKEWADENNVQGTNRLRVNGTTVCYWDFGDGYHENDYTGLQSKRTDGKRVFYCDDVPENCIKVRFDPATGIGCIVRNAYAIMDGTLKRAMNPFNGEVLPTGEIFFSEAVPHLEFEIPKGTKKIEIHAEIRLCATELSRRIQALAESSNSLSDKTGTLDGALAIKGKELPKALSEGPVQADADEQLTALLSEVEYLKLQNAEMIREKNRALSMYEMVVQSQCWKLTYPLRKTLDCMKTEGFISHGYEFAQRMRFFGYKYEIASVITRTKIRYHQKKKRNQAAVLPVEQRNKSDAVSQQDPRIIPCEDRVSVVIPTYNAGAGFRDLLELLRNQNSIKDVEIIVVDSGSSDETLEIAGNCHAVIITLSQEEFSHSHARNLGARNSTGKYILFMTQDAFPTGRDWLIHLLQPVLSGKASAVSCREIPRTDCDLLGAVSIYFHTKYMGVLHQDRIMSLPQKTDWQSLRRNAQLNDVTCLVEAEVFKKFLYRGNFAEDLELGLRLIKAGLHLCLLSSEQVIHSHSRPASYHMKRALVDNMTMKKIFPEYPMERLSSQELANRIITAAAVSELCRQQLQNWKGNTLYGLTGWFEKTYQKLYIQVKAEDLERIRMLMNDGFRSDEPFLKFLNLLYETYHTEYRPDYAVSNDGLNMIGNILSLYFLENAIEYEQTLPEQICDMTEKRLGQYAGIYLSCYYEYHKDKDEDEDDILLKMIEEYQKGV